ncbi:MAG: hypothetical protein Q8O67_31435 [Deltaproteobacteria bacterium]|nr:hypothetical protein [Deltaproteobacteria bacterium]
MATRGATSLVTAITLSASLPALPCSFRLADLLTGVCPFQDRVVPRNAELRIFGFDDGLTTLTLTRPDGTIVDVTLAADNVSTIVVGAGLLDPGAHFLTIEGREQTDRIVAFTVSEDVDDDVPAAPLAFAQRHTTGELFPNSCQSEWPSDVVQIAVDSDDALAFATLDGELRGEP